MKTLKEVNEDIAKAIEQIEALRKEAKKGESALVSKIRIYEKARNYLELNPSIESIQNQLANCKRWLKIYEDRFKDWLEKDEKRKKISNPREVFNEQCEVDLKEIKKWKSEVKFINYLLS